MIGKLDRLVRYMIRLWPGLVLIGAFTVVTSVTAALQPWPLKLLVDYALGSEEVPAPVSALLG